ncbi:uncharacterized protein E0L32_007940 [Thyridium curvatum]|uniref:Nucleoporin Nup54 alpha-helical domain-containing protein n=1 Tax=Thyridium curvatum TaxID=1093900 RepID=A0A507B1D1_9PEZI|nr:uncharacterized protein E0L32_007940 [Thyridium curvatum]TPX11079.1 hypothetical protein E0L32_007940 [Thyridium curvatum]
MSLFASLNKPAGQPAFGATTTGAFGQSQPAQPQQSNTIFGQSLNPQQANPQQQPQLSQSLGQPQTAQLGSSLWQPAAAAPHQKSVTDQMGLLYEKWNPASPNCVFKHYFYNKVDEARIPYYQPGPNEDPKEWEEALQNKPAPGFMPVQASGFQTLAERLLVQKKAISTFNAKLHEINASLDAILSRHDLETSVRSLTARRRHAELSKRCLALAAKIQVLRNRGYSLTGDEDDLKQKLQAIERGMQDPALSARMEELWSRLIVLRNYSEALRSEVSKRGLGEAEGLDEEIEQKAKKILEDYEKQLQHLKKETELLHKDFEAYDKEQAASAAR